MQRFLRNHAKLWMSTLAGVSGFFLAPDRWSTVAAVLAGWNTGVLLFLLLAFRWMLRMDAGRIRSRYQEEDPSAPVILLVIVLAALLSLIAIIALLATIKQVHGIDRTEHLALAGLTVVDSWLLVPTMFTFHYADLYYSADAEHAPLQFPHTPNPIFWDFVYFSFTIAAACQTADVATTSSAVRRTVTVQTLVSFLFNVSILGFAINVSAGLLG